MNYCRLKVIFRWFRVFFEIQVARKWHDLQRSSGDLCGFSRIYCQKCAHFRTFLSVSFVFHLFAYSHLISSSRLTVHGYGIRTMHFECQERCSICSYSWSHHTMMHAARLEPRVQPQITQSSRWRMQHKTMTISPDVCGHLISTYANKNFKTKYLFKFSFHFRIAIIQNANITRKEVQ